MGQRIPQDAYASDIGKLCVRMREFKSNHPQYLEKSTFAPLHTTALHTTALRHSMSIDTELSALDLPDELIASLVSQPGSRAHDHSRGSLSLISRNSSRYSDMPGLLDDDGCASKSSLPLSRSWVHFGQTSRGSGCDTPYFQDEELGFILVESRFEK